MSQISYWGHPIAVLWLGLGLSSQVFAANNPPTITGTPSTTIAAGSLYEFTPQAADSDVGDTLTYTIANKPGWALFDKTTGKLSGTPTARNAKTYAGIVIAVKDSKSAKASLPAFDLTVTNTAPEISGTPITTANTGKRYRFLPTASDINNDKLKFTVSRLPSWATFSATTGLLTGIPIDADIASYKNIVITASDGNLKTSLPAFNIDVGNPAPTISGTPQRSINSGKLYSFQPRVTDPNNTSFTFSIRNQPDWATFDTTNGQLTGTPINSITKDYSNIVISVSDGYNTVELPAFTITVVSGSRYTSCSSSLTTGEEFSCQLPAGSHFALNNAQQGMVIQPKTGVLHWKPTTLQTGVTYIGVSYQNAAGVETQLTIPLTVQLGETDPEGIYVAQQGGSDTDGDGSVKAPFASILQAAKVVQAGQTIYVRGGTYKNAEYNTSFSNRSAGSMARITAQGTETQPITLQPYGNEYVKLISDVNGLQFYGAAYWDVGHFEIEGTLQDLTLAMAMDTWWDDSNSQTTGRGLSTNGAHDIYFHDNVIHDFAGPGIANNGSDMIKVENNVIYNTGWFSTGGVHGVSNSYLTTLSGNENKEGLIMRGNLVFANQSRIISHVFSKGNVDLAIDEGNGLHAQNNTKTFKGVARVENNLLLFNGKGGFGINTMNGVLVKNNAFYQNAQVVDTGELVVQSSTPSDISDNLFQPLSARRTVNDSSKDYNRLIGNASTAGSDSSSLPASVLYSQVFKDTANQNFAAVDALSTMGVPDDDLQRMFATVAEYGITVQAPTNLVTNYLPLPDMKKAIIDAWPASRSDITLTDRATGYKYTYAQRCQYPNAPSADPCP